MPTIAARGRTMPDVSKLGFLARRFYESELESDPGAAEKFKTSEAAISRLLLTGWPASQLRERVAELIRFTLVEIDEPRDSERWTAAPSFYAELTDQLADRLPEPQTAAQPPRLRLVM